MEIQESDLPKEEPVQTIYNFNAIKNDPKNPVVYLGFARKHVERMLDWIPYDLKRHKDDLLGEANLAVVEACNKINLDKYSVEQSINFVRDILRNAFRAFWAAPHSALSVIRQQISIFSNSPLAFASKKD